MTPICKLYQIFQILVIREAPGYLMLQNSFNFSKILHWNKPYPIKTKMTILNLKNDHKYRQRANSLKVSKVYIISPN